MVLSEHRTGDLFSTTELHYNTHEPQRPSLWRNLHPALWHQSSRMFTRLNVPESSTEIDPQTQRNFNLPFSCVHVILELIFIGSFCLVNSVHINIQVIIRTVELNNTEESENQSSRDVQWRCFITLCSGFSYFRLTISTMLLKNMNQRMLKCFWEIIFWQLGLNSTIAMSLDHCCHGEEAGCSQIQNALLFSV